MIEIVILFGVGIAVVAGFLVAFENFGGRIKDEAVESQGMALGDVISANIAFLTQTGADRGSLRFILPDSLANEYYSATLMESGVQVFIDDRGFTSSNLNGLEHIYGMEGTVNSDYETAEVILDENEISIGG